MSEASVPNLTESQKPPTKEQNPGRDAAAMDPEMLKTLAVGLSNLVASRSRHPSVRAAAKLISTSLSRP